MNTLRRQIRGNVGRGKKTFFEHLDSGSWSTFAGDLILDRMRAKEYGWDSDLQFSHDPVYAEKKKREMKRAVTEGKPDRPCTPTDDYRDLLSPETRAKLEAREGKR